MVLDHCQTLVRTLRLESKGQMLWGKRLLPQSRQGHQKGQCELLSPSLWYNCCFPGCGSKYRSHSASWILLPDYWHRKAPTWHPVCSVSANTPASRSDSCGSPGVLCLLVTRQCPEWQLKAQKKGKIWRLSLDFFLEQILQRGTRY